MGAGASTLPPEDKVVIAKAMQEKYNDFQNSHNQMNPDDEIQLFETLKWFVSLSASSLFPY